MLSFFSKKKQNSETPTDDVIQGPADPTQQPQNNGGADDFIFIERKTKPDDPTPAHGSIYPPMPSAFGGIVGLPYPPLIGANKMGGGAGGPLSYLHGVPFELSPQLSTKNVFEITQMQVDGILAFITRQLSIDESSEEYSFTLERSIQNECY